ALFRDAVAYQRPAVDRHAGDVALRRITAPDRVERNERPGDCRDYCGFVVARSRSRCVVDDSGMESGRCRSDCRTCVPVWPPHVRVDRIAAVDQLIRAIARRMPQLVRIKKSERSYPWTKE